jgi:hypothetical protein
MKLYTYATCATMLQLNHCAQLLCHFVVTIVPLRCNYYTIMLQFLCNYVGNNVITWQ